MYHEDDFAFVEGLLNEQPLDDFYGLSAAQMFQLLHNPFEADCMTISYPADITTDEVPLLKLLKRLDELATPTPLKLYASGNLAPEIWSMLLKELHPEEHRRWFEIYKRPPYRLFLELTALQDLLGMAKLLIPKRKGFALRTPYDKRKPCDWFLRLIVPAMDRYNWNHRNLYTFEGDEVQYEYEFYIIYLVSLTKGEFRMGEISEQWKTAFETGSKIYDPYAILRMLEFFGLTKSMHDGIIRGPYLKTPLFDRVFKFTPAAPFDPMVRIRNHTQDPARQKELANLYRQLNETRGLR